MIDDLGSIEARIAQISGEREGPPPGAFTAYGFPAANAFTDATLPFAALVGSGGALGGGGAPAAPSRYDTVIAQSAKYEGIDPALVRAVIANESSFNPDATSPTGAQGLMQLMPATAAGLGVSNAYDPAQNIAGGTHYLAELLTRFGGDVPRAIAAYNAGPGAIDAGAMPAETRRYVAGVLGTYERERGGPPS